MIVFDNLELFACNLDDPSEDKEKIKSANKLLSVIDAILTRDSNSPCYRTFLLGITNDSNSLDKRFFHHSRFYKTVAVNFRKVSQRAALLSHLSSWSNIRFSNDLDCNWMASVTSGYSCSDLERLLKLSLVNTHRRSSMEISRADVLHARNVCSPSMLLEFDTDSPAISWSEIGGYDDVKQKLVELIDWPINHAESFSRLGGTPPQGILLYGPSGWHSLLASHNNRGLFFRLWENNARRCNRAKV